MRVIYGMYRMLELCCRAFSRDVTVAILVFQNNGTAAMLVYPENLWELNSFLMYMLSFVPIN